MTHQEIARKAEGKIKNRYFQDGISGRPTRREKW
jgi:hypothetical protein